MFCFKWDGVFMRVVRVVVDWTVVRSSSYLVFMQFVQLIVAIMRRMGLSGSSGRENT
jgi:hypothetical protein